MNSQTSEMPQDSTLRRHWQSARDMQAASTSPSATNKKDTTDSASNAPSGGILSWMKSLFS